MTTLILDEYFNSSLIEDVAVSAVFVITVDYYENLSNINTITVVLIDEFINNNELSNITINASNAIIFDEFVNTTTIENISNVYLVLNLNSFLNTSTFAQLNLTFDQIFNTIQFSNISTIYQILVNSQKIEPVPIRPISIDRPKFDLLNADERLTVLDNKTFSDFSIHFKPHPLTGAPALVFDEASINQSLKMIFFTNVYERPFSNVDFGASIEKMLFENFTESLRNDFITISLELISNNESRIIVKNIDLIEDSRNTIVIVVKYKIKKTGQIGKFTQALERA